MMLAGIGYNALGYPETDAEIQALNRKMAESGSDYRCVLDANGQAVCAGGATLEDYLSEPQVSMRPAPGTYVPVFTSQNTYSGQCFDQHGNLMDCPSRSGSTSRTAPSGAADRVQESVLGVPPEGATPAPGWMQGLSSNPWLLVGGAAALLFFLGRGK